MNEVIKIAIRKQLAEVKLCSLGEFLNNKYLNRKSAGHEILQF